ncbi:MAG: type VI secretion system baseplate subunit TssF [Pseudomonadota bacterium]
MAESSPDSFLTYYQRELQYLRQASSDFAQKYPKIARRLELGAGETPDPHVERLIESFAYLTAGLQQGIDDKFSRFTSTLLGVLYPQFTLPTPSTTIAHFAADPSKGKLNSKYTIDRGTPVFCRSQEGVLCHFKTCYDTEIWPIEVTKAEIVPVDILECQTSRIPTARVLRLRIASFSVPIQDLGIEKLRFYLSGSRPVQNALYELLFSETSKGFVVENYQETTDKKQLIVQHAGEITPVGFANDEAVIPTPIASHPAYRYLFEYFNCPQKFLFFDVAGLATNQSGKSFDLLISVPNHISVDSLLISAKNFPLGCTPIINLFEKTSEPIRLDHKATEYRLVADYRRERTTEIHSIREVFAAEETTEAVHKLAPYFSFNHHEQQRNNNIFWHGRRDHAAVKGLSGTDMYLSFVDYDFSLQKLTGDTVYARVLCTNRALAHQIPPNAQLESQESIPARGSCLEKPNIQVYPPQDGDTQWRLISQLGTNHLSFGPENHAAQALKETLQMYAGLTQKHVIEEVELIKDLVTKPVTRRFSNDAWRGFAQGTQLGLHFSPEAFGGGGALLFSAVLNEFFALFAAVNSFTELEIYSISSKTPWKKWQPNSGKRYLL